MVLIHFPDFLVDPEPDPEPNRNRSRNRDFYKVGTGTAINHYGSTTHCSTIVFSREKRYGLHEDS